MEFKSNVNHKGYKTFYPDSIEALRSWLEKYGEIEKSVWILLYKKNANKPTISTGDVVKHSLCFGWVDSKTHTKDFESYYMYISQRNSNSNWSAVNKSNIANIEAEGLMHETGIKLVQHAKKTGTWNALNDVENLVIPKDLETAMKEKEGSEENFLAFNKSAKRGILHWIFSAKKPETRANRIARTARMAGENKRSFYE